MESNRTTKPFKGKAIYRPTGKAGEYSAWACNFFTGCSNNCDYCYCKRGVMSHVWTDHPKLKKCFKDEDDAMRIFVVEMWKNIKELRKSGLFFTFTSDPMLPETQSLTLRAIKECIDHDIPVQILTKCADIKDLILYVASLTEDKRELIAIGFTLTCHDEMEPGASSHDDRIIALKIINEFGCRTFASIEPIITLESAGMAIKDALPYCELFKVGLMSGGKKPDKYELLKFVRHWNSIFDKDGLKVYWKRSISDYLGDDMEYNMDSCVDADFNIFDY